MSRPTTALYCGSFDPFQYGHAHMVKKGLEHADRVLVVCCGNYNKQGQYIFPLGEAGALARFTLNQDKAIDMSRVRVITSSHSMLNCALDFGVDFVLRGARDEQEEEYEKRELQDLKPFLPSWTKPLVLRCDAAFKGTSSSRTKAMVAEGMNVSHMVAAPAKALLEYAILMQVRLAVVGPPEAEPLAFCDLLAGTLINEMRLEVAFYSLSEESERVLESDYEGARRLQEEVAKAQSDSDRRRLLQPYVKRKRRQFFKKSDADVILVEANDPYLACQLANQYTLVLGTSDTTESTRKMADWASMEGQKKGFGEVRMAMPKTGVSMVKELLRGFRKWRKSYARDDWAVPTHSTARRGSLWDDPPGGTQADWQDGVSQAGGDGRS